MSMRVLQGRESFEISPCDRGIAFAAKSAQVPTTLLSAEALQMLLGGASFESQERVGMQAATVTANKMRHESGVA